MADKRSNVDIFLRFKDQASSRFKRATSQITRFTKPVAKSLLRLTKLATGVGLALGGIGALVGNSLLQTGIEFENLTTRLNTLSESSEKAQESLQWIKDFTAQTPFQINQVTNAFVRLKALGLDPKDGVLAAAGNAAAALGTDLIQAVEAIADATTGEFERLKEFGIRAKVQGDEVVFQYTDSLGKIQNVLAEKQPDIIRETIKTIWNERYAGAMEDLSNNFSGIWSNILDLVTQFKVDILAAGPFEALKDGLKGLLEELKRLREDGTLKEWAEESARFIIDFFEASTKAVIFFGKALVNTKSLLVDFSNLVLILFKNVQELRLINAEAGLSVSQFTNIGGIEDENIAKTTKLIEDLKISIGAAEESIFRNINENTERDAFLKSFDELDAKADTFFNNIREKSKEQETSFKELKAEATLQLDEIRTEVDGLGGSLTEISDNTISIKLDSSAAEAGLDSLHRKLAAFREAGKNVGLIINTGGGAPSVGGPQTSGAAALQNVVNQSSSQSSVSIATGDIIVQGGGDPVQVQQAVQKALADPQTIREVTRNAIAPELARAGRR